jgi:hypothetical protein
VLHVCAKPRARLYLIETQPPLIPEGVTVERYSTAHHFIFEKHIDQHGIVTWYKSARG